MLVKLTPALDCDRIQTSGKPRDQKRRNLQRVWTQVNKGV